MPGRQPADGSNRPVFSRPAVTQHVGNGGGCGRARKKSMAPCWPGYGEAEPGRSVLVPLLLLPACKDSA